MTIFLSREPLLTILLWVQRLLFGVASTALAYWLLVFANAWVFQHQAHQLANQWPISASSAGLQSAATGPPLPSEVFSPPPWPDHALARLDIDRLHVSVIVAEGVSAFVLSRAAGHIPGTALPGQGANIGISAHRDTFFRPLEGIRRGDIATLTTRGTRHSYRVVAIAVVAASKISVLDPGNTEALTLITCHPFHFVGPAPNRFVVRAERI